MNSPKISVIIPVYNVEKYLRRCIDSILAQTFTDFELLLIDDGSKDKSGEICDEYAKKDSRVRVFHKENGGVSSARNLGLDNASGEWVCFVDSDDMVKPEYFASFMMFPDCDLIVGGYREFGFSEKEYFISSKQIIKITNVLKEIEFNTDFVVMFFPWGKFFKNDIIKKNGITFNEKMRLAEDFVFIIDYSASIDKVFFVPFNNYLYRKEENEKKHLMNYDTFSIHVQSFLQSYNRLCISTNSKYEYIKTHICSLFFYNFLDFLRTCQKNKMKGECFSFAKHYGYSFIRSIMRGRKFFRLYLYLIFAMPSLGFYILKR